MKVGSNQISLKKATEADIDVIRKNGIASLLFLKLIEEAKQRNLDRVDLHATKDGEPLYRKFGFREPEYKVLEFVLK